MSDSELMSATRFNGRIRASGSSAWPVEAGRYRLAASKACPFASRALITRRLLGLENAISVAVADPIQDALGWRFLGPDGRDPVLGIRYLCEAYFATEPGYSAGVSVPAVIDVPTGRVATNDFETLSLDLATEWAQHQRPEAPQLYPEHLRAEIDELNAALFADVNLGVYEVGMATTQEAHTKAYRALFARLDLLEERLSSQRYLLGDTITEADIRLFTSLVRFDVVYHDYFRCNRNKLTEMPALWAYARDLFQTPGFGDTVDFDHIKRHYYLVLDENNPRHIIPEGPDLSGWLTAHGREALGGRPFGDGTPPGPPPESERTPAAGQP